jgi:hypothetical protein
MEKKNKYKTDLNFKIESNLRSRLYSSLKAQKGIKTQRTAELLGCEIDFLKEHLAK